LQETQVNIASAHPGCIVPVLASGELKMSWNPPKWLQLLT